MVGPRTPRNPCRNPPLGGKDELTEGPLRAPPKGSNTSTHFLAVSRALTLAPPSTNELFKQFMKAYLKSNQGPSQPPEECKQPFNTKVLDVYYGKLHIDCYHFCQQEEVHYETSWGTGTNQTSFVASFLYANISVQWIQFKRCQGEAVTPITWAEFKTFLWKNMGESKSFVNSIWKKLKKDFQYQLEKVYN